MRMEPLMETKCTSSPASGSTFSNKASEAPWDESRYHREPSFRWQRSR